MSESFPRQQARTRRFTLGVPRAFTIAPDGTRVVFLRTKGGDDPVTCLWELDVATGTERLVADPRELGADEADLPPEERARRERVRETAGGIVSYATDEAVRVAVFALSGQVYATSLGRPGNASTYRVPVASPALDPRPDPNGTRLGYVHEGALHVAALNDSPDSIVAAEPGVTYGLTDFVSAEEMGRTRGFWWSPDGRELLVARVDESPVQRWYISDPANPDRAATEVAYPAAGTQNARVTLHRVSANGSAKAEIDWDHDAFPYLVEVNWDTEPLIVIQSRDQKTMRIIDAHGQTVHEDTDQHWTDVVFGVPARTESGELVWTALDGDTRRLLVGGEFVTPAGLQVRAVTCVDEDTVMFTGSAEPTDIGLWTYSREAGLTPVCTEPGVHSGRRRGGTTVTASTSMHDDGTRVMVNEKIAIPSLALRPNLATPSPAFFAAGERELRTAVLLPSGHQPGTRLPVLLDPYGGPGAQRVLSSRAIFLTSQWFAEQGFAVVVSDGRGTPGRGPAWDRAVAGDLASPALEDQVTALHEAAARYPDLDLTRVGIRGWSFGGFLAALAIFRRPDVFHAAVAGAPVTDWQLYDTHYTERYLGMPEDGTAYEDSGLRPGTPHRPLLLIHGLADDNVVAAHTLRLSSSLLAAGYPHSVLPLSGVTHMTPQEVVTENLLLLQARFLHSALNGG
jgi:dipeptidyl-peptidase-4